MLVQFARQGAAVHAGAQGFGDVEAGVGQKLTGSGWLAAPYSAMPKRTMRQASARVENRTDWIAGQIRQPVECRCP